MYGAKAGDTGVPSASRVTRPGDDEAAAADAARHPWIASTRTMPKARRSTISAATAAGQGGQRDRMGGAEG
jgi:hypothetical protein